MQLNRLPYASNSQPPGRLTVLCCVNLVGRHFSNVLVSTADIPAPVMAGVNLH